MLLFRLEAKKGKKALEHGQVVKVMLNALHFGVTSNLALQSTFIVAAYFPFRFQIGVKYESVDGVEVSEDHVVTLSDTFTVSDKL